MMKTKAEYGYCLSNDGEDTERDDLMRCSWALSPNLPDNFAYIRRRDGIRSGECVMKICVENRRYALIQRKRDSRTFYLRRD